MISEFLNVSLKIQLLPCGTKIRRHCSAANKQLPLHHKLWGNALFFTDYLLDENMNCSLHSTLKTFLTRSVNVPIIFAALVLASCSSGGGDDLVGGGGAPTPTPVASIPTPTPVVVTPTPTPTPVVATPTPEPVVMDQVTLSGSVNSFPDSGVQVSKPQRKNYALGAYKTAMAAGTQKVSLAGDDSSFSSSDMVPTPALVSIFLLSDVDFENPIATVPTFVDGDGNQTYEITVDDVRDYLIGQNLASEDATEQEFVDAFRALGQLQVRAMIIKEDESGGKTAIAIQSIADPNNLDETTGVPVPVVVDPIVHRVVKAVVDQIRDAILSLQDLGLSETLVNSLADVVIAEVLDDITQVIADA
ncbi:MAG: hypothetical protein ACI9Y1_000852, partial [Lentisphaeria bacterium]